jgi:RNA polymerase sigma factor (sigma-70 family)
VLTFPQNRYIRTNGILLAAPDYLERNILPHCMSDERQLLKDLQKLDPEAITEIHNRYFASIFRYARYRLGDSSLAEDIVSETFVRLLNASHNGKGPRSSMRGWLMGTASNLINDHFRQSYNQPVTTSTENLELAASVGNPALDVEHSDRQQAIREALLTLPAAQQHVLALRFGSGCTLLETAEIMNKKPNAIKQLQFRALNNLRQQLGGDLDA